MASSSNCGLPTHSPPLLRALAGASNSAGATDDSTDNGESSQQWPVSQQYSQQHTDRYSITLALDDVTVAVPLQQHQQQQLPPIGDGGRLGRGGSGSVGVDDPHYLIGSLGSNVVALSTPSESLAYADGPTGALLPRPRSLRAAAAAGSRLSSLRSGASGVNLDARPGIDGAFASPIQRFGQAASGGSFVSPSSCGASGGVDVPTPAPFMPPTPIATMSVGGGMCAVRDGDGGGRGEDGEDGHPAATAGSSITVILRKLVAAFRPACFLPSRSVHDGTSPQQLQQQPGDLLSTGHSLGQQINAPPAALHPLQQVSESSPTPPIQFAPPPSPEALPPAQPAALPPLFPAAATSAAVGAVASTLLTADGAGCQDRPIPREGPTAVIATANARRERPLLPPANVVHAAAWGSTSSSGREGTVESGRSAGGRRGVAMRNGSLTFAAHHGGGGEGGTGNVSGTSDAATPRATAGRDVHVQRNHQLRVSTLCRSGEELPEFAVGDLSGGDEEGAVGLSLYPVSDPVSGLCLQSWITCPRLEVSVYVSSQCGGAANDLSHLVIPDFGSSACLRYYQRCPTSTSGLSTPWRWRSSLATGVQFVSWESSAIPLAGYR